MLVLVFNLFLAGSVAYAFVRGGAPEKVVAVAFVVAATATYFWRPEYYSSFRDTEVGLLIVDSALLIVLVAVALAANRFWPIWIAALQLFALLVHIAKAYQQDILPLVYFVVTARLAYPMLLMLVFGALFHFRRVQRHGSDPDWSSPRT